MQMKILGIDPGLSHTGWATILIDCNRQTCQLYGDGGVIKTQKWRDKDKTVAYPDRDRIDTISRELETVIKAIRPDIIVVEDFVYYGNKGKVTSVMPALIENLRMLGFRLNITTKIYANGDWKVSLLKNRQAKKNQVQHFIHRALNLNTAVWDKKDRGGHIRDAMGLGLCEAHIILFPEKREQRRKLKNVKF